MQPRYATPADLVEALQGGATEARARLCEVLAEPLGRLMGQLISRHRMAHQREHLTLYALHLAETWLRTRPAATYREMSWAALRSAALLQVAKLASQPFGGAPGSGGGPAPLPECPAYDSQTFFRPHQRVGEFWFGGDWFAGRHADDGSLWVIVADVTGHGYLAYLLASGLPGVWENCWQALRSRRAQPAELLAAMHELLRDCLPDGIYAECVLVRLGPEGETTVAPAGGARLLLRRRGTPRPDLHKLRGTWLGLSAPTPDDQRDWRLEQGDELLLGSDGLFDQLSGERGDEVIERLGSLPHTATLFESVQRLVEEALERGPQKDDITMLLLRRRSRVEGAAPRRPSVAAPARVGRAMFQCDCPPDNCADKVRRYLAGERAAGDALAHKFEALVRGIVQRVLGPGRREEWDDACQAIFLRLFTNLDKWEERCPFCKWLAVLAARRAIDLSRLADPMQRLPDADLVDPRPPAPDRETIERIEQAVARFPAEWRQVWDWWVQGMRREEMAKRAGKSLRTVQYWLAEMLDQLRESLGE